MYTETDSQEGQQHKSRLQDGYCVFSEGSAVQSTAGGCEGLSLGLRDPHCLGVFRFM